MKLVIAEKPQMGAVIAQALGIKNKSLGFYECNNDFVVTWCIGHILELSPPESYNPDYKNWVEKDLPLQLRPLKLKIKESTKEQFDVVKSLLLKADSVVNAGDFDDEGQLLVDEVINFVGFQGQVLRIIINDLNVESVKKALSKLEPNEKFAGMYKKALARSQADFLVGINLSRAYTINARKNGINEVYSVGRVQTPTLGLIVNRYLINKNHNASFFYTVKGDFQFSEKVNDFKLVITDNVTHEDNKIVDEEVAKKIKLACENQISQISNKEIKKEAKACPLPFSLLDLQAHMNNKFGFSADKTLKITQSLREKHKAITYNRSDCRYLTSEQLQDAEKTIECIKNLLGNINYENIDINKPSRAFNDEKVTAHTGIIPVKAQFNINDLTKDELVVYEAIAKQYLIQFMPNKEMDICTVTVNCADYEFKLSASAVIKKGWSNIINDSDEDEENTNEKEESSFNLLSSLKESESGSCLIINIQREKTKPPPIYTEATLLKDLQSIAKYIKDPKIKALLIEKDQGREGENGGIGTPATRSAIIKNLFDKGFFTYEGKKLIPTIKGISFIQSLPDSIVNPDMTALWFEKQLDIENNTLSVDDFLNDLDLFILDEVNRAKAFNIDVKQALTTKAGEKVHSCPACEKGIMQLKKFNDNSFFGCSNYPDCKHTIAVLDNAPAPPCPCCKKQSLKINSKAISCECGLTVWRTVANKELSEKQLVSLLVKGKTGTIKGFTSKAGKAFDAILSLNNNKVEFIFNTAKGNKK